MIAIGVAKTSRQRLPPRPTSVEQIQVVHHEGSTKYLVGEKDCQIYQYQCINGSCPCSLIRRWCDGICVWARHSLPISITLEILSRDMWISWRVRSQTGGVLFDCYPWRIYGYGLKCIWWSTCNAAAGKKGCNKDPQPSYVAHHLKSQLHWYLSDLDVWREWRVQWWWERVPRWCYSCKVKNRHQRRESIIKSSGSPRNNY